VSIFLLWSTLPAQIADFPGGAWGLFLVLLGAVILISVILKSPPFKALAAILQALAVRIGGRAYIEQQQIETQRKLKILEAKLVASELKDTLRKHLTPLEVGGIKRRLPRGTITILFSDIEDWTPLVDKGQEQAAQLLEQHHQLVQEAIDRHDGIEVKGLGDGFMLAFPSAKSAIACALEIQQAMTDFNQANDQPFRVRIGIHSGEPIQQGEDYIGQAVNLASRIQDEAKGGQILVSEIVKNLAGPIKGLQYVDRGFFKLQGITEKQRLYEVLAVQALAPRVAAADSPEDDLDKPPPRVKDTSDT
jgi:class 3 adenylate cyclase